MNERRNCVSGTPPTHNTKYKYNISNNKIRNTDKKITKYKGIGILGKMTLRVLGKESSQVFLSKATEKPTTTFCKKIPYAQKHLQKHSLETNSAF